MILFLWDSSNCPLKPARGMLMIIQTEARSEETRIQKFTWIFRLVRAWTFNCKHVCNYKHQNHLSNWAILHYLEKLKCIIINPKNHIFLILGEIHICIQGSDTGSIIPKLKLCSRSHLAFYRELFHICKTNHSLLSSRTFSHPQMTGGKKKIKTDKEQEESIA